MAQAITIDLLTAEPIAVDDDSQEVTFDMIYLKLRLIEEVVVATGSVHRLLMMGVGT